MAGHRSPGPRPLGSGVEGHRLWGRTSGPRAGTSESRPAPAGRSGARGTPAAAGRRPEARCAALGGRGADRSQRYRVTPARCPPAPAHLGCVHSTHTSGPRAQHTHTWRGLWGRWTTWPEGPPASRRSCAEDAVLQPVAESSSRGPSPCARPLRGYGAPRPDSARRLRAGGRRVSRTAGFGCFPKPPDMSLSVL